MAGESLMRICRDDHMPHRATVHHWSLGNRGAPPKFIDDYALARVIQAQTYFDEVLDISDGAAEAAKALALGDDAFEKTSEGKGAEAYRRVYNEEIQARRLRVDSRKWVLGRMDSKTYGDKSSLDLGGQAGNPVGVNANVSHAKLDEEGQAELRKILRRAITETK